MTTEERRLRVLVRRIDNWEDLEGVDAVEAAEELILDIKQCLESVLETLPNLGAHEQPTRD